MNIPSPLDPEDLFWQQIQDRPGDPLPRLLYADWCDENDRPIMSTVQRWLAATNRFPTPALGTFVWRRGVVFLLGPGLPNELLPAALFDQMGTSERGSLERVWNDELVFDTQRHAEEALVNGWERATSSTWRKTAWEPVYPVSNEQIDLSLEDVQWDGAFAENSRHTVGEPIRLRNYFLFLFAIAPLLCIHPMITLGAIVLFLIFIGVLFFRDITRGMHRHRRRRS